MLSKYTKARKIIYIVINVIRILDIKKSIFFLLIEIVIDIIERINIKIEINFAINFKNKIIVKLSPPYYSWHS